MLFHATFILLILVQLINPSLSIVTHARALLFTAVDKPEEGLQHHVGTVDFFQQPDGHVVVKGNVADLDAGDHGFHIHVYGVYGQKCVEAGAHFNPANKAHGGPNDTERHVGDLGNIHADANGNAQIKIQDSLVALNGPHSAIGRSVVVHFKPDDLGKGSSADSKKTGNAGPRFACGIIGVVEEDEASGSVKGNLNLRVQNIRISMCTPSLLSPSALNFYAAAEQDFVRHDQPSSTAVHRKKAEFFF
uniref:Superoxide dismutase [Cu-Zn] n=1 Tax=Ditylenchus dipsaci TaxID=166011 RepID=A0A915EKX0_9BILA